MPLPRSFLYVPANRGKFLDKAVGLPADAFILDLGGIRCRLPEKNNARAGVKAYAPKIGDHRVWVRVNGLETGLAEADLDAVIGVPGLAGIFLPKVETSEEVLRWDTAITALEKARGLPAGSTRLVLSLESALGVLNAYSMSIAAPRVASLSFGGAQDGDLNTDLGCTWSSDGPGDDDRTRHGIDSPAGRRASTLRSTACSPTCAIPTVLPRTPRCRGGLAISRRPRAHPSVADRAVQPALCAEPSVSSTIMRACWRRSKRRSSRAAPPRPWTAR